MHAVNIAREGGFGRVHVAVGVEIDEAELSPAGGGCPRNQTEGYGMIAAEADNPVALANEPVRERG